MPGAYGFLTKNGYDDGTQVFKVPVDSLSVGEKTPDARPFNRGDVILDAYLCIYTAEVTGATKTINVGLSSAGADASASGFLVGASTAATGTIIGLLVGTDTLGALLKEDTNAGAVLVRKPFAITQADSRLVYTLASAHTELVADIYVRFWRPTSAY